MTPIITGSEAERELCGEIADASQVDPMVLAGRLSILEFAALTTRLKTLIIGDTGPTHVAGAMGLPVIALFGPTEAHKNWPWGVGHAILVGECSCAERSWETCTYACMESIHEDTVIDTAIQLLKPVGK